MGGVTATGGFSLKVAQGSVAVNVNYSHVWSGSSSDTLTNSTSDTWSAPGQAITVPPHSEADVKWILKGSDAKGTFVFEGPIQNTDVALTVAGRLIGIPDEEINPGKYQAFDSDIITIPNQMMYTDLFTLLRPAKGSVMPEGLSYDPKTDGFYLHGQGNFTASTAMELDLSVTIYKIDANGNRIPDQHPETTTTTVNPHVTPET